MARRSFGTVRKMRSGRYQVSYIGPDNERHNAPATFERKADASTYLSGVTTEIARGTWEPPGAKEARERAEQRAVALGAITFEEWADKWLKGLPKAARSKKTVQTYGYRIRKLKEEFGSMEPGSATEGDVDSWHARILKGRGVAVSRRHYVPLSACLGAAACRRSGPWAAEPARGRRQRTASVGGHWFNLG